MDLSSALSTMSTIVTLIYYFGFFILIANLVFLIAVPIYLKKILNKLEVLHLQTAHLNRIATALEGKTAPAQQTSHHQPCVSDIGQQHGNAAGYQYHSNIPNGDIFPNEGFEKL